MMEGVTILNTWVETVGILHPLWVILFAAGVFFFFCGMADDRACVSLMGAVVVMAAAVGIWAYAARNCTEQVMVEAVISQEASFAEIAGRYEVVEQRGEIFVLQEKEDVR